MHQHPGRFASRPEFSKETFMNRISVQSLKPRNPLVAACRQRHAGVHQRSAGGQRQMARRTLNRELVDLHQLRKSP
jgi:hypothetical protein